MNAPVTHYRFVPITEMAYFSLSPTGVRDTPPHISSNLKAAGNDFTQSDHPQAEPTMSLYGWPCCLSAGFPPLKRSEMCFSDTFLASCITIQPAIRYSHLPASFSLSSFLYVRQKHPFMHYTELNADR